jgi:hypothetical protein
MLDSKYADDRAAAFVKSWHDHCLREGRLDGTLDKVAYKELVQRVAGLCMSIADEFGKDGAAASDDTKRAGGAAKPGRKAKTHG